MATNNLVFSGPVALKRHILNTILTFSNNLPSEGTPLVSFTDERVARALKLKKILSRYPLVQASLPTFEPNEQCPATTGDRSTGQEWELDQGNLELLLESFRS